MRRSLRVVLGCFPLLLAGCLSALSPASIAPNGEFHADGGVIVDLGGRVNASASFDAYRVIGPHINVTKRADGTWAGTLKGQLITVSQSGTHIAGSMLSLDVKQDDQRMNVGGVSGNGNLRITITRRRIEVKMIQYALAIPRTAVDRFGAGNVQLLGSAMRHDAPQPQLALALLGSL